MIVITTLVVDETAKFPNGFACVDEATPKGEAESCCGFDINTLVVFVATVATAAVPNIVLLGWTLPPKGPTVAPKTLPVFVVVVANPVKNLR